MKQFPIILTCILFTFSLHAQTIHSPAEIIEIMEKSEISYNLDILEEPIICPDRTDNLNNNNVYREVDESGISTYYYNVDPQVESLLAIAEQHYEERSLDSARTYYEKILELDPTYYTVMTYIGQMLGSMNRLDEGKEWYIRVIEKNYIDYLAHWLLADIYLMQGEIDNAVTEITIARILNRNNPRLQELQLKIYKEAKLSTDDWCFNPQYVMDHVGIDQAIISFDSHWLGYALTKAVWRFEPGYKESMGITSDGTSMLEEKESLASLIIGLENSKVKIKKIPEFSCLKKAIDKGMIDAYILYEIILPDYPFVAYQLPEEVIQDIADYIVQIRHG